MATKTTTARKSKRVGSATTKADAPTTITITVTITITPGTGSATTLGVGGTQTTRAMGESDNRV
jgi:hypothetical protein